MRDRIEDLSIHARRGELGESGLRQLALALESSREARLFHDAGCEFDKSDSVLAGDDAIARRVIGRVMKVRDGKSRRRLRSYRFGLAMVAWTAAAAAAAPLLVGSEVIRPGTNENKEIVQPRGYQTGSRFVATRPVQQLSQPETAQAPVSASRGSSAEPRVERPRTRTAAQVTNSPSRELNTSSQVFAEANRLRRIGRPSDAIKQYAALQKQFPDSAEARAANLALGVLRLQGGWAEAALGHFSRYLDGNSSGDLVPEALWGQAQALAALGRTGAARRNYATLLRRYPESAYASAARAKLQVEP